MSDPFELIHRYFDGSSTDEEAAQLAEWLARDAEHVRLFVRECHLHRQIREKMVARRFSPGMAPVLEWSGRAGNGAARTPPGRILPFLTWRRTGYGLAASGAVVALVISVFRPVAPKTAAQIADASVATITACASGATVKREESVLAAGAGFRLLSGDIVRTAEDESAMVQYAGEATRLELKGGTELQLTGGPSGKRVLLHTGEVVAIVAPQPKGAPMVLSTRQAETKVVGTQFGLSVGSVSTWLEVTDGLVEFLRLQDGRLVEVPRRQYAVAAPTVELSPEMVSEVSPLKNGSFETGDFNRWWIARKHRPEAMVSKEARFSGEFGVRLVKKGRLDQVFDTLPGRTYAVAGKVRIDRELTPPPWGGLRVQVVDDTTAPWTRLGQSSHFKKSSHGEGQWIDVQFAFTANRDHARLVYQNFGDGDFEVSVDDFVVTLKQ
jgi:ferric-dicitrate binding protein FerR (iron transport regulator)